MSLLHSKPQHRRAQVVETLYGDRGTFLIGGLAVALAAGITAFRMGGTPLWALTAGIAAIAVVRLAAFELFLANQRHAERHPRVWNQVYFALGVSHLALIGLWMATVFSQGGDYFSELLSLVVSLGFLIGTQGRNFSNLALVRCQFAACIAPPLVAIFRQSPLAGIVLTGFAMVFYVAVVRTSARIREMLRRAIEASEESWRLAHMDGLTGLVNRVSMQTTAKRLIDEGEPFSFMMVDLDDFKRVNETLGQIGGDAFLRQAALTIEVVVGDGGLVARGSSDEFWVLQPRQGQTRAPTALAQEIVDALSRPAIVNGVTMPAGCSLGLSCYPQDGQQFETVLHHADMALFDAKAGGKGRFVEFRPGTPDRAAERLMMESDLRRAVQEGDIVLHFQPIVSNATLEVVGCEALARWTHPTRGPVSPAEFLPVAEDAGLMDEMTDRALVEGCRAAARWPARIGLSLNLSPSQLRRPELIARVSEALESARLDPARLELEITENLLLDGDEDVLDRLHGIRALGVRLSLDDFGTGYSNLVQISRLPISKIKLDKSFAAGIGEERGARFLVGAVQFIAPLGFEIVLEGVETDEQIAFARRQTGIALLQGFAFGRAMPASCIEAMLDEAA